MFYFVTSLLIKGLSAVTYRQCLTPMTPESYHWISSLNLDSLGGNYIFSSLFLFGWSYMSYSSKGDAASHSITKSTTEYTAVLKIKPNFLNFSTTLSTYSQCFGPLLWSMDICKVSNPEQKEIDDFGLQSWQSCLSTGALRIHMACITCPKTCLKVSQLWSPKTSISFCSGFETLQISIVGAKSTGNKYV